MVGSNTRSDAYVRITVYRSLGNVVPGSYLND